MGEASDYALRGLHSLPCPLRPTLRPAGTLQSSTVKYVTVQHSTVQYGAVQYGTVQCSTV